MVGFLADGDLGVLSGRYGGILEAGNREYTLADFHSLNLDKLDRFSCLREDKMSVCRSLPPLTCLLTLACSSRLKRRCRMAW